MNEQSLVHTRNQPGDFTPLVELVLDGLHSENSKTAYRKALRDFLRWHQAEAVGLGFTKGAVQRWVEKLRSQGFAASTINVRLAAVRKLAGEAADNELLPMAIAQGIQRVKGAKQAGVRTGNWLTLLQAEALIDAPKIETLKGKRDRAILALLVGTGLRRTEISDLTFRHIQQRDGRWAIVDLKGKGERIRTVPMPSWAKVAVDAWTGAAGLSAGRVFRPVNKAQRLTRESIRAETILKLVAEYGRQIGVPKLAPHDLRRTYAKLAHKGHAALEQIQLSLGHATTLTTERYLGVKQDLQDAPCDHLGLRLSG
jgi:site-specific recombinase XerD